MRAIFLIKFVSYIDKFISSGKQGNAIQFGLGCVSLEDSSEFRMRIGQKAVRGKQVQLRKKIKKEKIQRKSSLVLSVPP